MRRAFYTYSDDNPRVSPCGRCKCIAKSTGRRCKLKTCKHQPCCHHHNRDVAEEVDARRRIARRWVASYRSFAPTKALALRVIEKIIERIGRLLVFSGVNRQSRTTQFRAHGKNLVFLMGALPRALRSPEQRQMVIDRVLRPCYDRSVRFGDRTFEPELALACKWLNWYPAGMHERIRALRPPTDAIDMPTLLTAEYASLNNYLINAYIKELAAADGRPWKWIDKAIRVMLDRYTEIDAPLELTKSGHLKAADDSMHKVYFITHIVLMCNDYGTRKLREALDTPTRRKLVRVLRRWFYSLRGLEQKNLEVFYEITYCLLYLDKPPAETWDYFQWVLHSGASQFQEARLAANTKRNVFYPNDRRLQPFFADYHSHAIIAAFIAESVRHKTGQSLSRRFVF